MNKIERFHGIARREGLRTALWRSLGYICEQTGFAEQYRNRIWPNLPVRREHHLRNGIRVAGEQLRWLDRLAPFRTPGHFPSFKGTNLSQIRETVSPGDSVGIVGAGFGVSTVVAARKATEEGSVTAYEGNEDRLRTARETVSLNGCAGIAKVEHAVVGTGFGDFDFGGAAEISPEDLPAFDVLELDCEGAEYEIIPEITIRPRIVIVELHHRKDWTPYNTPEPVRNSLEEMGYGVEEFNGPWVDALLVATREQPN